MSEAARLAEAKSGVRIVVDPVAGARTAALSIVFGAGSRDERDGEEGAAHLLEHAVFRGAGPRAAREIDEAVEDVGGELNASTTHQRTAFYARVRAEDWPLALDVLADIVRDPHLKGDDVARERDIVLQEIAEAEEDGEDVCLDLLQEAAFGSAPLGRPVLARADQVRRLDAARLKAFIARAWAAEACVVSIAGGVDPDAVVARASDRFADWPHAAAPTPPEPARFVGGARAKDVGEQAHLGLAFAGPGAKSPARPAARLLAEIWGGGMSSRLNRAIREERGLAYTVYSFADAYLETGLLGAYAAGEPEHLDLMEELTRAELASLAEGPTPGELARAKAQKLAGGLMARESLASRAEARAVETLVFGGPVSEEEYAARIEAVAGRDVAAVALEALGGPSALSRISPED